MSHSTWLALHISRFSVLVDLSVVDQSGRCVPSRLLSAWRQHGEVLDQLVEAVDGFEDRVGDLSALLAERLGEAFEVLEVPVRPIPARRGTPAS